MVTTFNEIFEKYRPKQEYSIIKGIGSETGRYIACVFKKVEVNGRRREIAETSVANFATKDLTEYFNFLSNYIEKVNGTESN